MGFLRFIFFNIGCVKQVSKAKGLLKKDFKSTSLRDMWTLSAWDTGLSMQTYVNNGAHLKAIKNFRSIADIYESKVVRWEADELPTWEEAMKRNNECDYEYEKSGYSKLSK